MNVALRWSVGLAASLGLHVAAGFALLASLTPKEVQDQPMPETRMEMVAHTLDRSEARVAEPEVDPAAQSEATGAGLEGGAIPSSRAETAQPQAQSLPSADAPASQAKTSETVSQPVAAAAAQAAPVAQATAQAQSLPPAAAPQAEPGQALSPQSDRAATVTAPSTAVQAATPEASTTAAATPSAQQTQAVAAPAASVAAAPMATAALTATTQAPPALAAAQPVILASKPVGPAAQSKPAQAAAPAATPAVASALEPTAVLAASAQVAVTPTVATPLAAQAATAQAPAPTPAALATAPTEPATTLAPQSDALANSQPETETTPAGAPTAQPVDAAAPEAAYVKAALAFPGGDSAVDPVSFAAFQSFMEPGDVGADQNPVRDGVAGILSQVPCARLQVGFDPETTTLTVNGHIPEDGLRPSVMQALQAQMGTDIAVSDNMLILPRPQCNALSGIAAVGLAQSTDQFTNPLVIGDDAHARVFGFAEGDYLSLDMTAPDYDAVIYLDYFDADGNVLHLEPNEYSPLRRATAKTAQRIGARSARDSGLQLIISPPFGQEIAVAFAASHPLYDGLRPIQEPAAPYLEWLEERVTLARETHPDFKGEWVYFFVTTSAK